MHFHHPTASHLLSLSALWSLSRFVVIYVLCCSSIICYIIHHFWISNWNISIELKHGKMLKQLLIMLCVFFCIRFNLQNKTNTRERKNNEHTNYKQSSFFMLCLDVDWSTIRHLLLKNEIKKNYRKILSKKRYCFLQSSHQLQIAHCWPISIVRYEKKTRRYTQQRTLAHPESRLQSNWKCALLMWSKKLTIEILGNL